MADPSPSTLPEDGGDEGTELEELEEEVKEMARRILDYRATLPDQLKATLSSVFESQRPAISALVNESDPVASTSDLSPVTGRPAEADKNGLSAEVEHENNEKLQLLKRKISSNASALPTVLRRMKECISRIEELESCHDFICPAFKKKRNT